MSRTWVVERWSACSPTDIYARVKTALGSCGAHVVTPTWKYRIIWEYSVGGATHDPKAVCASKRCERLADHKEVGYS